MSNLSICRVCLKGSTKTYSVVNSPLQVMYENLTNNKLITKDGRPHTVCSICIWTLINCCKFKEKSGKSGEILKQLSKHGIEILPETLSAMNRGIQQDYCVTPVESTTFGSLYGNIVVKKEVKAESEPDSIPPLEDLSLDAKLCRVCLVVSTRTYNELGQLAPVYEKITDSKLSAMAAHDVCYICCARLQRCKDLVSKASKSEKIIAELARNGIQLSQETVNILNRKIEPRFTKSPVETFSYNPHVTKSVNIKEEKRRIAVETNIGTIIKQEHDRNNEDLGQYDDKPGQYDDKPGQSGDKHGQICDNPDQSGDKIALRPILSPLLTSLNKSGQSEDASDQSDNEPKQIADKADKSGDESEQSGEESDQSGNESEQSCDKPDPSGDELGQSGKEDDHNCGEIGDNCKVCKAKLDSQEKVERHKRLHDPERKYACNKCSYSYDNKSHLNFHKRTHSYNNKCEVCGKSFTHIRLLKRHMWLHNGNVYKCRTCAAVFRYGYQISKHNLARHPEVDYDCKFCKKAFTAEHRLFEHVFKDHARDFPHFTCDYCRKKYTDLHTLTKHMNFVHLKSFKHKCDKCRRLFYKSATLEAHKKICYKKVEIVYKCESCPKSYLNKYTLIRHEIIHTGERNFKCEICDKAFRDKYAIKNHLKYHNPDSIRLTCDFCEKTYLSKYLYQEHVMTHVTGIKKPYSCDECHMNFTFKCQLKNHMNKHSENPKYKPKYDCKICNKKVVSLSEHMSVHSDNKPYACDVCDTAFRRRSNLRSHKISHSKEKPFVCNKCGKSFASKPILKNHILSIHTDRIKPHLCMHCNKAFGTSMQLTVHMRTHTGEKPFKCDKCHKKFSELRSLQSHKVREHSNVKKSNYICDLCHTVYLEKKDMIRHVRSHKGKRNFRCGICNKFFLDMVSLSLHLIIHTKKSVVNYYCMFCKQSFSMKLSLNRHYFSCHDGYKEFACNICEEGFSCYRNLNGHIQKLHKAGYMCTWCIKSYTKRQKLLRHMSRVHGFKQK